MALPVAQIMNQLQRGVTEERIDVDDDDEEAMADVEDMAIVVQMLNFEVPVGQG